MKIFFTFIFCIYSLGAMAQNIIENHGFEDGKNPWILGKYHGAAGLFLINDTAAISELRSAQIQVDNPTDQKRDLRLFQTMELKSGITYEISFKAKAQSDQEISIDISNDVAQYWSHEITVKSDQSTYGPFIYESADADIFSSFGFNLGLVSGAILIDSVVVNELKPTAVRELELANKSHEFNHSYRDNNLFLLLNSPVENYGLLSLSDFSGKTLFSKDLNIHESEIYIEPVNPGFYLLEMTIDDKYFSKKLLLR